MALALFWILFVLAAILPVRWVVYLFFTGLAFGSFNTLPGGFNLTPYAATAPLLAARLLAGRGAERWLGDAMLNPLRFGGLTAFVLFALVVTATGPALFAGVITIGLNTNVETPLHYGMGNVSQSIYLVTAWLVALSLYVLVRRPGGPAILAQALLLGGATVVIAGMADLVTAGSNALAPLRTAKYAIITEADIAGMHRVIGFNTEASGYGAITLFFATSLLCIRPSRFAGPWCRRIEPALTLALFVFCFLSTSSAAYLGLAATVALYGCNLLVQAASVSRSLEGHRASLHLLLLLLSLWAAGLVVMFNPALSTPARHIIEEAVFQKAGSESYLERMSWSRVSMAALLQTGGYGLGLGSTRASSLAVAIVSSTGVFGTMLLAGFSARCLLAPLVVGGRRPASNDERACGEPEARLWRQAIVGARLAFVACLVPAASAATTVDLSLSALFFAIMACAGGAPVAGVVHNPAALPRKALHRRRNANTHPALKRAGQIG